MARPRRFTPGGFVYHVFNRGSRKGVVFDTYEDYSGFVDLLDLTRAKSAMRIIAYCMMPTHFHLLLWPPGDTDVPAFMHRLTTAHAGKWHRVKNNVGTGAVYQSRYVSVGITSGQHYFTALRYVERNALEAHLVQRAQDWPWCSASQLVSECPTFRLDDGPCPRPNNWLECLND